MLQNPAVNVDPLELEKFSQLAHRWWDRESEFKPLHDINPLRLDYIDRIAPLSGKAVLDVGCGGGILTEAMAGRGAQVTGIDLADKPLKVARLHLLESGLKVEYIKTSAEELARSRPQRYDVVTCMELLEHVPDPGATVRACSELLKPDGFLFCATINRNPKSYLFAVIGAEYVLKLLPRGTHDYQKFIKPSELAAMCRRSTLSIGGLTGMTYNPFTRTYALGPNTTVNYILHCQKG
ncbi:MAG: bifunctional 2-polyprenyl-6-hydroxyphenol methylase/3-demethylubiquinol 3-O-methyltransferase UbiG [Burkholderiales bacterium]